MEKFTPDPDQFHADMDRTDADRCGNFRPRHLLEIKTLSDLLVDWTELGQCPVQLFVFRLLNKSVLNWDARIDDDCQTIDIATGLGTRELLPGDILCEAENPTRDVGPGRIVMRRLGECQGHRFRNDVFGGLIACHAACMAHPTPEQHLNIDQHFPA